MTSYNRPGRGVYVTNGESTLTHGQAVAIENFVGVAIKQKGYDWNVAVASAATIAKKEDFFLITKGVVMIPMVTGIKVGDGAYLKTGTLTKTKEGDALGRVVEIEGERGTPTGFMRVDLDLKFGL